MTSNFLITIIGFIVITIIGSGFLITRVEPNIYWVTLFIFLFATCVTLIFSLIFYKFAKPHSFEKPKDVYRRQLRKSVIIGLLVVFAILSQKFFDLL